MVADAEAGDVASEGLSRAPAYMSMLDPKTSCSALATMRQVCACSQDGYKNVQQFRQYWCKHRQASCRELRFGKFRRRATFSASDGPIAEHLSIPASHVDIVRLETSASHLFNNFAEAISTKLCHNLREQAVRMSLELADFVRPNSRYECVTVCLQVWQGTNQGVLPSPRGVSRCRCFLEPQLATLLRITSECQNV